MGEFVLSNEMLKDITVVVKIKKARFFDIRLWIGRNLIKLGALIAGLGYEESEQDQ